MPVITTHLIGRFGNQMFQYAFARAYAEKHGYDFQCDTWIGQQIFNLDDDPIIDHGLPKRNEDTLNGEGNIDIAGYAQQQSCLIYTRKQVREWFTFRDSVLDEELRDLVEPPVAAHRRVGDYGQLGYVVVSRMSYHKACKKYGYDPTHVWMFTEEGGQPILHDFYRMTQARVLFRGNSTFSWWAGTLGTGKVFSPMVEALEGGKEQDCEFVEGNWPRFANLPFITDLHLKEG